MSTHTTDSEILSIVAGAIARTTPEQNWADNIDAALTAAGVETGERPDGQDPEEVAALPDGRMIVHQGGDEYGFRPDWRAYTTHLSTEPSYYGGDCTAEDAKRIVADLSGIIQDRFPGIVVERWSDGAVNGGSAKTTGPDAETREEINEWVSENWTAAL